MKKIIIIAIVVSLIAVVFFIRKKAKEEQKRLEEQSKGNYIGVNTPSGTYGLDIDQVSNSWDAISELFGNNSNGSDNSSGKNLVNCSGMTAEERSAIAQSTNYQCA